MRTFIALALPETLRDGVGHLARRLAQQVPGRFVPRENYHLTLAFLGEIGEEEARDAIAAMDEVASSCGAVRLSPLGLGTFGRPSDCTPWLGIKSEPELMDLAAVLRERLDVRGIAYDRKPFRPHITLARRTRIPKGVLAPLVFPESVPVTEMTLYKSTLSPEGAAYKPLYTVELGGLDAGKQPGGLG